MTLGNLDWYAGWFAGRVGVLELCPPRITGREAWHAGHAGGTAARRRQIDRAAALNRTPSEAAGLPRDFGRWTPPKT